MQTKSIQTVTFANMISNPVFADKLSEVGRIPCGIIIPNDAAFNLVTLTVQVSVDGINYYNLYDDIGEQKIISIGSSRAIFFDLSIYAGFAYLQFVASSNLNGKSISIIFREV